MLRVAFLALASTALIGNGTPDRSGITTYRIPLSGAAESNIAHPWGGTGDPNGFGSVTLAVNPTNKQVCYDFKLSGVATPLMAHIHQGGPLKNGPPVVTLFTGPGAKLDGCVTWLHGQLAQIVGDPADFYVDIDTIEYPDGALRGQLSSSAGSRSAG
jgi:hypothetical protein